MKSIKISDGIISFNDYYYYTVKTDNKGNYDIIKGKYNGMAVDIYRRNLYLVFKTREAAIDHAETEKLYLELKRRSSVFTPNVPNYVLSYDVRSGQITVEEKTFSIDTDIIFKSKTLAEKVIKKIGTKRLMKYYFKTDLSEMYNLKEKEE